MLLLGDGNTKIASYIWKFHYDTNTTTAAVVGFAPPLTSCHTELTPTTRDHGKLPASTTYPEIGISVWLLNSYWLWGSYIFIKSKN